MDDPTQINLSRFISIGDNCEFGFVQRAHGIEPGSLLRWAITSPDALASSIGTAFKGIFEFDNLTPSADDMVLDSGTGIYFHTQMRSKDRHFLLTESARREIYRAEKEKLNYLVHKQLESFLYPNIFVYKQNSGLSFENAKRIADAIATRGPAALLIVSDKGSLELGSVNHILRNIYIARIDHLAPYEKADRISLSVWDKIINHANEVIPS